MSLHPVLRSERGFLGAKLFTVKSAMQATQLNAQNLSSVLNMPRLYSQT